MLSKTSVSYGRIFSDFRCGGSSRGRGWIDGCHSLPSECLNDIVSNPSVSSHYLVLVLHHLRHLDVVPEDLSRNDLFSIV